MDERVFRLTPLTPVHIGAGEVITPEEYKITGQTLIRFNPHAIVAAWDAATRRRFEQAIEANNLDRARQMLHEAADQPRFQLYRAAMGAEAAAALRDVPPDRRRARDRPRGEVHILVRNLHAGKVVVPGSAIKGAIRTAIVNALAARNLTREDRHAIRQLLDGWEQRGGVMKRNRAWEVLETKALVYQRDKTERDPLRGLRVSDGDLPAEAVRVDRVVIRNRSGEQNQARGIQLHVERLLSRADRVPPPSCQIRIALAEEWTRDRRTGLKPLGWEFVIEKCNDFFMQRYAAEVQSFSFLQGRRWIPAELPAGAILLRVGRFSHFESLSVDELRSGWNAQRRRPIEGMGSSRSLCLLDNGVAAPFGWVLLESV